MFPAQYSTLSASALNDYLQSAYGLTGISTTFLVRNVSDTYVIRDEQPRYILKIYRDSHRSRDQIQTEVALLNYLKENGAKVAYPIADVNGAYLQSFEAAEGTRYGVLFQFAPGAVAKDLTSNQLEVLGHEMALNHQLLSREGLTFDRPVYNVETTIHQPLQVLQEMFEQFDYPEGKGRLQEIISRTLKAYELIDTSAFSVGYCHYDYMPKNFHFTDKDDITFFDWDFFGKGFLVNDLMSFQVHYFLHKLHGFITQEQANDDFQAFVAAYRERRDISDRELAAIPVLGNMFWVFYLAVQFQGFNDFSNPYFNKNFIKAWLGRIEQWEEFMRKS